MYLSFKYMAYEIVKPTIVKVDSLDMELQFYVSSDGKDCGVSQSALARMCGVSETPIRNLINKLNQIGDPSCSAVECLKSALGKVYSTTLKGDASNIKLANIINSEAAACIIEYYAYESKASNKIAKKTYRAFARIGIEKWIKQITGYDNNEDRLTNIEKVMTAMLGELKEVKETLNSFERVVTVYPKIDSWKAAYKELPAATTEFSMSDYFNFFKLNVKDTQYRKVRLQIAQAYKTLTGEQPRRRRVKRADGTFGAYEYIYRVEDFPMIKDVLDKELEIN